MDTQAITTLISTVGYPIAAFCWSAWMIKKERDDSRAEMEKLRTEHRAEVQELTKVLTDNNTILTGLKQLIEDKLT